MSGWWRGGAELLVLKNRAGTRGYVDLNFDARDGPSEDMAEGAGVDRVADWSERQ